MMSSTQLISTLLFTTITNHSMGNRHQLFNPMEMEDMSSITLNTFNRDSFQQFYPQGLITSNLLDNQVVFMLEG